MTHPALPIADRECSLIAILALPILAMAAAARERAMARHVHRRRRRLGLTHPSIYGGVDRKRFIIETNGAGVALVDYDNDGWLDALVLSGTRLEEGARRSVEWPAGQAPTNRLYRNLRNGKFHDVTAGSASRAPAGRRLSARATTTTTAGPISSSRTTARTFCIEMRRQDVRGRHRPRLDRRNRHRWGSGCTFIDYRP